MGFNSAFEGLKPDKNNDALLEDQYAFFNIPLKIS